MPFRSTFFSMTEMVMRQFPVKSSAPVRMTMMRPNGKSSPETIFATDGFVSAWPAVFVTAAPMPMRKPAKTPRTRSFVAGDFAFFCPMRAYEVTNSEGVCMF